MSSRANDKRWAKEGDQWKLYASLYPYVRNERCMAVLKKAWSNAEENRSYIWSVMDVENNMEEPSEITIDNAEGYEDFDTLEEAQLRVEECIQNRIESLIDDLETILELFE